MTQQTQDYEQALIDPMQIYSRPAEVLNDTRLSDEQKLTVLRRWEIDSRELQVAEDEGMAGGEDDLFTEVLEAIHQLAPDAGVEGHIQAPTKQGGTH